MATEIVRGKLLGVDRVGDNQSALVIEIHIPLKPVEHKKILTGSVTITPDWVVKNMGYEVECLLVNGILKSVFRAS